MNIRPSSQTSPHGGRQPDGLPAPTGEGGGNLRFSTGWSGSVHGRSGSPPRREGDALSPRPGLSGHFEALRAHAYHDVVVQARQIQTWTRPVPLPEPPRAASAMPGSPKGNLLLRVAENAGRGRWGMHGNRNLAGDLKFHLGLASPKSRAQTEELRTSRKIRGVLGNLLSSLTAARGDHDGFHRIRTQLARLAELCEGRISEKKGGLTSLAYLLDHSDDAVLIALRNGSLGSEFDRWNILNEIPSGMRREQAGKVWDQIADAVRSRFSRKVVQEPLCEIHAQLTGASFDANTLKEPLLRLVRSLDCYVDCRNRGSDVTPGDHPLHVYLDCLPENVLHDIRDLASPGRLDRGVAILQEANEVHACRMLDCLRVTLLENIEFQSMDDDNAVMIQR